MALFRTQRSFPVSPQSPLLQAKPSKSHRIVCHSIGMPPKRFKVSSLLTDISSAQFLRISTDGELPSFPGNRLQDSPCPLENTVSSVILEPPLFLRWELVSQSTII